MPNMDGIEFSKWLKNYETNFSNKHYIVSVSGTNNTNPKKLFNDFIVKPFDILTIYDSIIKFLKQGKK